MASFELSRSSDDPSFAAVTEPSVLQMPDGRKVLLAAVRPGDAHVAQGFFAAMFLDGSRPHLFVMEGGGSFGDPGRLSVPAQQPLGAFHVWLEGGGSWMASTVGWAAITDFSGSQPRNVGGFRTYAHIFCDAARAGADGMCRDVMEYRLSSIRYSDNGPDELTLTWTIVAYDTWKIETYDPDDERHVNVRERTITARYELRGGAYRLAEGEEPPVV
jgi:hypothetical protein